MWSPATRIHSPRAPEMSSRRSEGGVFSALYADVGRNGGAFETRLSLIDHDAALDLAALWAVPPRSTFGSIRPDPRWGISDSLSDSLFLIDHGLRGFTARAKRPAPLGWGISDSLSLIPRARPDAYAPTDEPDQRGQARSQAGSSGWPRALIVGRPLMHERRRVCQMTLALGFIHSELCQLGHGHGHGHEACDRVRSCTESPGIDH
jgi:hypothetical protein